MGLSEHVQRFHKLGQALRHAFAVRPAVEGLDAEEEALLQKVADIVVRRGMAGPAVMFLESAAPLNFLGSQALHFLTPILDLACNARELERVAQLLERRDAIPRLIALIEAQSTDTRSTSEGTPCR
jgi:hypothetical protein